LLRTLVQQAYSLLFNNKMLLWLLRLPSQPVLLLKLMLKSRHNQALSNRLLHNQVKVPRLKLKVRCRANLNPKSWPLLPRKLRVNRLKKLTLKNRTTTNTTIQRSTRKLRLTEEDQARDMDTHLCKLLSTFLVDQLHLPQLPHQSRTPQSQQTAKRQSQHQKLLASSTPRLNPRMSSISSLKMLMFQLMRLRPSLLRFHQLSPEITLNLLLSRVSERSLVMILSTPSSKVTEARRKTSLITTTSPSQ